MLIFFHYFWGGLQDKQGFPPSIIIFVFESLKFASRVACAVVDKLFIFNTLSISFCTGNQNSQRI
jgi:hypothetical protein